MIQRQPTAQRPHKTRSEASWVPSVRSDRDPTCPRTAAPAFLASLYQQQGRFGDASTAATRALALQPTDPLLLQGLHAILDGAQS